MLATLLAALVVAENGNTAPIHVDSCIFVRSGSFERSVHVRFHNTSSHTVTQVAFDVYNGPHHVTVSKHGTFARNVTIDALLTTPTWELYHAEADKCVATYVKFADGSTWQRGASGR